MVVAVIYYSLLRKKEKDVADVGCVAQSEKSTEGTVRITHLAQQRDGY